MTQLLLIVLVLIIFLGLTGLAGVALLRGYSVKGRYKVPWLFDMELDLRSPPRPRSRAPPRKQLPPPTEPPIAARQRAKRGDDA